MKNKEDIVRLASKISGFTKKDMGTAYDAFVQAVAELMQDGEDISIFGFGKIIIDDVPEKKIYDINNGGFNIIPPHKNPKFKFSDKVRESVKNIKVI